MNVFFYLYAYRGIPLITMATLWLIIALIYNAFKLIFKKGSKSSPTSEWFSEDLAKVVYIWLYSFLNKLVQEIRGVVLLKKGLKSISKLMAIMYLSLFVKFLGDKALIYFGKNTIINLYYSISLLYFETLVKKETINTCWF